LVCTTSTEGGCIPPPFTFYIQQQVFPINEGKFKKKKKKKRKIIFQTLGEKERKKEMCLTRN